MYGLMFRLIANIIFNKMFVIHFNEYRRSGKNFNVWGSSHEMVLQLGTGDRCYVCFNYISLFVVLL